MPINAQIFPVAAENFSKIELERKENSKIAEVILM